MRIRILFPVPASVISPLLAPPSATAPASIVSASNIGSTLIWTACRHNCPSTTGGGRRGRRHSTCVGRHFAGGGCLLSTAIGTFHAGTGARNHGRLRPSPLTGLLALPPLLLPSVGLPLALFRDTFLDLVLAEPTLVFEPFPHFQ